MSDVGNLFGDVDQPYGQPEGATSLQVETRLWGEVLLGQNFALRYPRAISLADIA